MALFRSLFADLYVLAVLSVLSVLAVPVVLSAATDMTFWPRQAKNIATADRAQALTAEFFRDYPDYSFCRNLAANVESQLISHADALSLLAQKAWAIKERRAEIEARLDSKTVRKDGETVRLRDLSLTGVMRLDDEALRDALEFYFKYPFSHGRTSRARWLPRLLRTFFLSVAVGHARSRNIRLDYAAYFEMLRML